MKTLGIDLGGTDIKFGILAGGKILFQGICPTSAAEGYPMVLAVLIAQANRLLSDHPDVRFLGIGSPGIVDTASGTVLYSNNFAWQNVSLGPDLSAGLGMTVRVANDAHCAALGEAIYGAGVGCDRMAMLTVGTGTGGGFVRNGRLEEDLYGSMAYTFGHMVIEHSGRQCNCGRRGCLETYASAGAMAKICAQIMPGIKEVKELFTLARAGDTTALQIVDRFIETLCEGAVNIANILRPQKIVIGGGVSGSGDFILPKLQQALKRGVYGYVHAPVEGVCAALGNSAGLIGAGNLYTQYIQKEMSSQ